MTRHKLGWLTLFMVSLASPSVLAGPGGQKEPGVLIQNGFHRGRDFLDLKGTSADESIQRWYVSGLLEGMLLAPLLGAPEKNLDWLRSCSVEMSDLQVAAILRKHLTEHPELWHQYTHTTFYSALRERCPKAR